MNNLGMDLQFDDPIGRAVQDFHYRSINQPIVVHSNDFDDDTIETAYLFRSYAQMPPLEKKALSLCRGKILDVGACAGAHSIYLQQNGHEVYSLDSSKLCCEVMHDRQLRHVINQDHLKFSGQPFEPIPLLMKETCIAELTLGLY